MNRTVYYILKNAKKESGLSDFSNRLSISKEYNILF